MQECEGDQVAAVAALDEPTRRRLYDYVVRQPGPVSRDEAATALELPRTTAAFHLDRLADQRLLDVVFERRTGRTGPGAGRPAKLYRRATCEITVSLPERRYDLAGQLLAATVEDADRSGVSPRAVLDRRAYELGAQLAQSARAAAGGQDGRATAWRVLEAYGYEPRAHDSDVALGNCPFHALVRQHTELVCGMNLRVLTGLLDGLAPTGLGARLDPASGRCCVKLEAVARTAS
ncbi:helix-turn-helix transcriptional regulator [Pseudonocardia bannensis]|uniref:Helix-turn-helix domain-containing protein n=1 Tax=Pseudonocardia bannensis TaxID=630973 RepID=A0A848DQJ9_9PSEU|nr:helix-turn-helix domain-containing protein [Pseudonocardia bannensis]NMH95130.1 helix-turn-helix domain-containing protein [Pseudonocardia bannensis]